MSIRCCLCRRLLGDPASGPPFVAVGDLGNVVAICESHLTDRLEGLSANQRRAVAAFAEAAVRGRELAAMGPGRN